MIIIIGCKNCSKVWYTSIISNNASVMTCNDCKLILSSLGKREFAEIKWFKIKPVINTVVDSVIIKNWNCNDLNTVHTNKTIFPRSGAPSCPRPTRRSSEWWWRRRTRRSTWRCWVRLRNWKTSSNGKHSPQHSSLDWYRRAGRISATRTRWDSVWASSSRPLIVTAH